MKHRLSLCWLYESRIRFSRDQFIILHPCYINDETILIFVRLWQWRWELNLKNFFSLAFFKIFLRIFKNEVLLFQNDEKENNNEYRLKKFELKLIAKKLVWKFYVSKFFFLYLINNIDRIYYNQKSYAILFHFRRS